MKVRYWGDTYLPPEKIIVLIAPVWWSGRFLDLHESVQVVLLKLRDEQARVTWDARQGEIDVANRRIEELEAQVKQCYGVINNLKTQLKKCDACADGFISSHVEVTNALRVHVAQEIFKEVENNSNLLNTNMADISLSQEKWNAIKSKHGVK